MFYGLDCEETKCDDYYKKRYYGPTQKELDTNEEIKIAWESYLKSVEENIPSNVH